ncbi:MAG: tetratricopeptide repeat protein [Acidobacteriaceae bacterium]
MNWSSSTCLAIRLLRRSVAVGVVAGCVLLAGSAAIGQQTTLADAGSGGSLAAAAAGRAAGGSAGEYGYGAWSPAHEAANDGPQQGSSSAQTAPALLITPELRADTLLARQRYQEAIAIYSRIRPQTAEIENKIGVAYQRLNDDATAIDYYQQAIATDRRFAPAYNNLGTIYFQQKQDRKARRLYRKSIRLDARQAAFWGNLGMLSLAQKQYSDAVEAFQHAFKLDPDIFEEIELNGVQENEPSQVLARLYLSFAEIYARAGMKAEAMLYLRKAFGEGFRNLKMIQQDQQLASLHGYPAYEQLVTKQPR